MELLVVVAIIGVLVAITIPAINVARAKARDAKRTEDLRNFSFALEQYYENHQQYPVWAAGGSFQGDASTTLQVLVDEGYIVGSLPEDPLISKYIYYYKTDEGGYAYKIVASMEKDKEKAEKDGGSALRYYEAFAHRPEKEQVDFTGDPNDDDSDYLDQKMPGAPLITWAKAIGGTAFDAGNWIEEISNGYIIAGQTKSWGAGDYDALISKLNSQGELNWAKIFGGTNGDQFNCVKQISGGYIVVGYTNSFGSGGKDGLIIKLDSNGGLVWGKVFGGTSDDEFNTVYQDSGGNYLIAGSTNSYGPGTPSNYNALIIKLNSNGSLLWAKVYGGDLSDFAQGGIEETSDGGYIVGGSTMSYGVGNHDMLILKLTNNGEVSWAKTFGGASNGDYVQMIHQTADSGYILTGYTWGSWSGALVMKLASNGGLDWVKTYGSESWIYPYAIDIISGGYLVTGAVYQGTGSYPRDYFLIKLGSNGNFIWGRKFGGSDYSEGFGWQTQDGGYVMAGYTQSFGSGEADVMVLKLNSEGLMPGCNVNTLNYSANTPSLSETSPSVASESASLSTSSPSFSTSSPTPVDTTICGE